jgi:hypothetical protein
MEDKITVITGIEWILRFRVKAQSHYSIAPWTINFVGHSFSLVLQFNRGHNDLLRADGYNIAGTLGGGARRFGSCIGSYVIFFWAWDCQHRINNH